MLLSWEMGKTLAEAQGEVAKSADHLEFFGGLGRSAQGEVLAHEAADVQALTLYEPRGIVLAIAPWNDPLLTPARKLAPALLAGNAVILKPASDTPLVSLELARCLDDAGLPAGAINTVTGSGGALSGALLGDARLDAVSFTGSNRVGEIIRGALAASGTELLAELGGKNATVVLADADLDRAADTIAAAGFAQAGQRCTATSRVIVAREVLDDLVRMLIDRAHGLRLGPGSGGEADMGPLVSASQRDGVIGFIDRATADGASVAVGGGVPPDEQLQHGCFVAPTVLTDVATTSEIWTEEVFGPVISVAAAADLGDALRLVNESRYGLAAAIFTADLGSANRFVREAGVGQVAVNLPTSGWDVHMPFGGFKQSGSGHKEQGTEGLHFYRRVKTAVIAS
jgi:aldehyde dehydrogenase (NAD+)